MLQITEPTEDELKARALKINLMLKEKIIIVRIFININIYCILILLIEDIRYNACTPYTFFVYQMVILHSDQFHVLNYKKIQKQNSINLTL